MNKDREITIDMLRMMCRQIARVRKCAIGAGEFTCEEIDALLGDMITEEVNRYENMSAQEVAIDILTEMIERASERDDRR